MSPARILDLEHVASWPTELLAVLEQEHEVFLNWEQRAGPLYEGRHYDRAEAVLNEALQPYALTGWHCTRLTEGEMHTVETGGLQLPDAAMLRRRINRAVAAGALSPGTAKALKACNQASDSNRAGRVWFCFFPPRNAGERGIERFFRHWGGEALYNSHEDNPVTSLALKTIGTPALVEADVPIALLSRHSTLTDKVARRFLISRRFRMGERTDHAGYIKHPLPAAQVRRIIRFPEPDFLALTGCAEWRHPVS